MRKRFVTTILLGIVMLLPSLFFTGCSSNSVKDRKYLLSDISVVCDEGVAQEIKDHYDEYISETLQEDKRKEVFLNFYENRFATNYDGSSIFGSYAQKGSTITITSPSTPERISFSLNGGKVLLTSKEDGATLTYQFAYSKKVERKKLNFANKTYAFFGTMYYAREGASQDDIEHVKKSVSEIKQKSIGDSIAFYDKDTFKAKMRGVDFSGTYSKNYSDITKTIELNQTEGDIIRYGTRLQVCGDDLIYYEGSVSMTATKVSDYYAFMLK